MMKNLDGLVMRTIDEVLNEVFENETSAVIFQYLTENGQEFDDRIRLFSDSLAKIVGTGSVIIEDLILETLYLKLRKELKRKKNYSLLDYILELKNLSDGEQSI